MRYIQALIVFSDSLQEIDCLHLHPSVCFRAPDINHTEQENTNRENYTCLRRWAFCRFVSLVSCVSTHCILFLSQCLAEQELM